MLLFLPVNVNAVKFNERPFIEESPVFEFTVCLQHFGGFAEPFDQTLPTAKCHITETHVCFSSELLYCTVSEESAD